MRWSRNNKRFFAATLALARRQKNINPMPVARRASAYSTSSRCVVCPTESYASKFPTCMINACPEKLPRAESTSVRRPPSPARCQRENGEPELRGRNKEGERGERRKRRKIPLTRAKISLIGTFLVFGETSASRVSRFDTRLQINRR